MKYYCLSEERYNKTIQCLKDIEGGRKEIEGGR